MNSNNDWKAILKKLTSAHLFWILLISAIMRIVYYHILLTTQAVDTASYVNYHANILQGETDALRTPVYPYFIKFIGLFGNQNLYENVVKVQMLLSFLSIIVLYKTGQLVLKNKWVIFAASLTYAGMLPVINFDKLVLTESLSVSCSLIFVYLLASYLKRATSAKAWILTLYVFIAIMLRPSFVYLLPFVIAFWILRWAFFRNERKLCLSGFAASGILILLVLGYSGLNERNVGFNGISVVSNNNEMAVIVSAGIYKNGNDPEISAAITSNILLGQRNPGKHIPEINIMKVFAPDRVHTFIANCIKNEPGTYAKHLGSKLHELGADNIFVNYAGHSLSHLAFIIENAEHLVFCVTFNMLYFFLVLDLTLMVVSWIRRKQLRWFELVLWVLIVGQMVVAIAGGYIEYQRLILPAMPALLILLFLYIDKIVAVIEKLRGNKTVDPAIAYKPSPPSSQN